MDDTKHLTENMVTERKLSHHLAGRAVIALRADFPLQRVSLDPIENGQRIICDWETVRSKYGNDASLLRRAFAFVYVGTIIDQKTEGIPTDELAYEISSDQSQAQSVRETAVNWGTVSSVTETNPFAHVGYKLASQIVRLDESLIEKLALELLKRRSLEQPWLDEWFAANAVPRSLNEIEESGRF